MSFIDTVIERARKDPRRILLPEPEDERTLRAAVQIEEKGIASVTLIGDQDMVVKKLKELGISKSFNVVDPARAEWRDRFNAEFHAMRKAKGLSEDAARSTMGSPIPHGIMMLHQGMADGMVAGAIHSTSDTLRPALQILKTAPGVSLVSSFFIMAKGDSVLIFADSGLVENPDAAQLAEIALTAARSAIGFGIDPYVAMLSYSTKGSAKSVLTDKVVEATRIAQARIAETFGPNSPVQIDGELQGDAALVTRVAASKAPGSPVAGKARVLIFPDLDAGNICYKLVQYLGGYEAYGPVLQGIRLPVNDLSRGCKAEDITGVAAVTVVQAQMTSPKKG